VLGLPVPRALTPGKFDLKKAAKHVGNAAERVDLKKVAKHVGNAAERVESASEDVRQASGQAKRLSKKLS
jgi:hypothetical protein